MAIDKKIMNLRLDLIRDFTETEGVKALVDVVREIINEKDTQDIGFKSTKVPKRKRL